MTCVGIFRSDKHVSPSRTVRVYGHVVNVQIVWISRRSRRRRLRSRCTSGKQAQQRRIYQQQRVSYPVIWQECTSVRACRSLKVRMEGGWPVQWGLSEPRGLKGSGLYSEAGLPYHPCKAPWDKRLPDTSWVRDLPWVQMDKDDWNHYLLVSFRCGR